MSKEWIVFIVALGNVFVAAWNLRNARANLRNAEVIRDLSWWMNRRRW